jgi:uncharacterized protein YneF (UPF0154 family)
MVISTTFLGIAFKVIIFIAGVIVGFIVSNKINDNHYKDDRFS